METASREEREVRAGRNQSLFRTVNEQLRGLNEGTAAMVGTFVIACECADLSCVETLPIAKDEYAQLRTNPRRFAVLPGHVYADVENVVEERTGYAVVEKIAAAAEVA